MAWSRFSEGWLSRYYSLLKLIRIYKPKSIIEVGTFDGIRACGMLEEALRNQRDSVTYTGYDLFETATQETDLEEHNVRKHYSEDAVANRLSNFCRRYAGRVQYRLFKGNSRKTLHKQRADFAFIDGGHSLDTIAHDYSMLSESSVVVLDDYYSIDGTKKSPDTSKVGCNQLVESLSGVTVLPLSNRVTGGGRVQMAVTFGLEKWKGFRLQPDKDLIPYVFHQHNCGMPTDARRTERTVELALAKYWLSKFQNTANVTEVGAVTPYYQDVFHPSLRRVVDPSDRKATIKKSLFDVNLSGQDVLSISTIEHVGGKQYGLVKGSKTPLDAFHHILRSASSFLITIPCGWPNAAGLQSYLIQGAKKLRDDHGVIVSSLTRQSDETWQPTGQYAPYGNRKKPWANSILIIERVNSTGTRL